MNTVHVVIVFSLVPEPFLPDGAHPVWGMQHVPGEAAAMCLCGWMYVRTFPRMGGGPDVDEEIIALALAQSQADVHVEVWNDDGKWS